MSKKKNRFDEVATKVIDSHVLSMVEGLIGCVEEIVSEGVCSMFDETTNETFNDIHHKTKLDVYHNTEWCIITAW